MRIDRLAVAGIALAVTTAMVLFAVLGSSGPHSGGAEKIEDPAASGRGAQLLNPHCRNVPPADFDRAPSRALTGPFDDAPYGYAVTIPAGLTAHSSPDNPAPGFAVVLSFEPRAYLRVDASYDVFYDISAAAVQRRDVQGVRLHDKVLAAQISEDALAGERAERARLRFQCPGDAQLYLLDSLIVVRNREIYRLELQTVPARASQDEALLQALQRSWRWVAVAQGS